MTFFGDLMREVATLVVLLARACFVDCFSPGLDDSSTSNRHELKSRHKGKLECIAKGSMGQGGVRTRFVEVSEPQPAGGKSLEAGP